LRASEKLWPGGIPVDISAKERNKRISDEIVVDGFPPPTDPQQMETRRKAIGRAIPK
jgi:hypothetical protein